jgi:hypothetical protein
MYGKEALPAPAVLLALVLAGCATEPLPPEAAATPSNVRAEAARGAPSPRPLTGRCETTFNPPPLPPPPVHRQTDRGSCRLAHLGRAEFYSVKDIDFVTGTQTTTEATFTAPDGDILRAVGSGTSMPGQPGRVAFSAVLTLTGGTGRFTHATGQAHVRGEAVLATRTATLEIVDGWIAYDASGRSGS